MPGYVRDQGSYQEITQPYTKQGGTWVPASKAYTKQGGTWVEWWPGDGDTGGGDPVYLDPARWTLSPYGSYYPPSSQYTHLAVTRYNKPLISYVFGSDWLYTLWDGDGLNSKVIQRRFESLTAALGQGLHRDIGAGDLFVTREGGDKYLYNSTASTKLNVDLSGDTFAEETIGRTYYRLTKDGQLRAFAIDTGANTSTATAPLLSDAGYTAIVMYPDPVKDGFYLRATRQDGGTEHRFLSPGGGNVQVGDAVTAEAPVGGKSGNGGTFGRILLCGVTDEGDPIYKDTHPTATYGLWILEGNTDLMALPVQPVLLGENTGTSSGGAFQARSGGPAELLPNPLGQPVNILHPARDEYDGAYRGYQVKLERELPGTEAVWHPGVLVSQYQPLAANGNVTVIPTSDGLATAYDNTYNFTQTITLTQAPYFVTYTGTQFVAFTGDTLVRSTDGTNWTETAHPYPGYIYGTNIKPDPQGEYLITQDTGTYWTDLDTWTPLTVPSVGFRIAAYGAGVWLGVDTLDGYAHTSTDKGATWVKQGRLELGGPGTSFNSHAIQSVQGAFYAHAWNRFFVSGFGGYTWWSTNQGLNWRQGDFPTRAIDNGFWPSPSVVNHPNSSEVAVASRTTFTAPCFTQDGGASWRGIRGAEGISLEGTVCVVSSKELLAAGVDGNGTAGLMRVTWD